MAVRRPSRRGPRVALAPCLSSLTAEAMCDGAISLNMDWQALGSGTEAGVKKSSELADRFGVLGNENQSSQRHRLASPTYRARRRHHAFRFGQALFNTLQSRGQQTIQSYCELETVLGGHGTAMIAAGYSFEPAIIRSLEKILTHESLDMKLRLLLTLGLILSASTPRSRLN